MTAPRKPARFYPPREAFDERSAEPTPGLLGLFGRLPASGLALRLGTHLVTALWSATVGQVRAPQPRERRVVLPGLPRHLVGLRLAHVSDVHCGPHFPASEVRVLAAKIRACRPDLVLLTGDLLHRDDVVLDALGEALSELGPPGTVLAVRGNHDRQVDPVGHRFAAALAGAGVTLLDNESRRVPLPGRELWVAGIDDLWEGRPDVAAALADLPPRAPYLFLTHSPDAAEQLIDRTHRPLLTLAGHTHGGQIVLPGYGPVVLPSAHGRRYARGLVRHRGLSVHISRGVGVVEPPIRLGAPAEVPIVCLESV